MSMLWEYVCAHMGMWYVRVFCHHCEQASMPVIMVPGAAVGEGLGLGQDALSILMVSPND